MKRTVKYGLLSLTAFAVAAGGVQLASADPTTDDEVREAHSAQAQTQSELSNVENELAQLSAQSSQLEEAAANAQAQAVRAEGEMNAAVNSAMDTQEKANAAKADVERARNELGNVSKVMYQNSAAGIQSSFYFMGADSLAQAQVKQRAFGTLASHVDSTVQEFQALLDIATTLQKKADAAAQAATAVAQRVGSTADAAQAASDAVTAQLATASARRGQLAGVLAAQKGTTADLEAKRLDDLEAERVARSKAAAAEIIEQARLENEESAKGVADQAREEAAVEAAATKAAAKSAQASAQAAAQAAVDADAATKAVKEKEAAQAAAFARATAEKAQRAEAEKAERERLADEARERAEAQRAAAERAAAEKAAAQARDKAEREAAQKRAAERAAAEKAAREHMQRQAQAKAAARHNAQKSANSDSRSTIGSSVVSYARQFEGVPYVWAGTSPNTGWDCVGFIWYVYQKFGITTPRRTGSYVNQFWGDYRQVPASQARPGDVLWWPGHVGLYTGNGMHIAAWNPSMGTQERAVWGNPVYLRIG
ncbi:NlpC/P60 family protein [Arcanobacterium canis]